MVQSSGFGKKPASVQLTGVGLVVDDGMLVVEALDVAAVEELVMLGEEVVMLEEEEVMLVEEGVLVGVVLEEVVEEGGAEVVGLDDDDDESVVVVEAVVDEVA